MQQRVFNIVKAPPDSRDLVFKASRPTPIPDSFSLQAFCPPVRDQGAEGSCGGQTATEMLYLLRNKYWQYTNQKLPSATLFAANDIYWRARKRMGDTQDDTGVDNRQLMLAMKNDGCCTEALRPYSLDWRAEPSAEANAQAAQNRIGAFHFAKNSRDMCEIIASGYPLVIGIDVFMSFMGDSVSQTGLVPMPVNGEVNEGGHDILGHSYDLKLQIGRSVGAIKCQNHWGKNWGQQGHFWLPLDYLDQYALDCPTAHFGKAW